MRELVITLVQKRRRFLIVNLIGEGTRLAEHGPAGLGVRVGMAGFAFVEKALAKRIDGDAIGVTVPIRFVADFDIGKSRIDGRRMRALPVARCLRAQVDRHHEHFPRVMLTAPHFHQVGIGAEIARAFFGAGLKAASAKNQRTAANFVFFIRIRYAHAFDATVVAEQRADA